MKKASFLIAFALFCASYMQGQSKSRPVYLDPEKSIEERVEDAFGRLTLDDKIRLIHAQSKFSSRGVPRLGIPDLWCSDGPHGIRGEVLWDAWRSAGRSNDSCVAFPALTCLASTWNPAVARAYGRAVGEEARYRGKDVLLGPGVNIYRTPLGGRNFEYLGEDPFLASRMVVPYIQGVQSNGVAACAKHFALNNDEGHRHHINIIVGDRALHEIYLPAYRAAVEEGHVWTIMAAYNYYKNQPCCANQYLLDDILRKQWKFDGVVITDWGAVTTTRDAALHGMDMEFGTHTNGLNVGEKNAYDRYYLAKAYERAIQRGELPMSSLDEKVRRVLRLHFRTTMNSQRETGSMCSPEHYATALKVAEEGIVLLQNKGGILPLRLNGKQRVLVVGENAIKMMTVGGGSSSLKAQHETVPMEGFKARFEKLAKLEYERGYVGDSTGEYNGERSGQDLRDSRTPQQLISDAVAKARGADYVIVVGGLNKSPNQDDEGYDRASLSLPYDQDELIEALAAVNKHVVFVNVSGNAVAMPWKDKVAGIVQAWYLGSVSGTALAAVLAGDVNPSGKLPFTFPQKLEDVGAHALKTFPGTPRNDGTKMYDETYAEGIYVGYRWVDHAKTKPLFAFGYGQGYTSFALSNLRASASVMTPQDSLTFTVTVKNTGKRGGAEVVQLYIHDDKCSVDRPEKELKGFRKVWLEPGESRDVAITIDSRALSFYNEEQQAWTAEPGTFTALVGNSSDNLKLRTTFSLK